MKPSEHDPSPPVEAQPPQPQGIEIDAVGGFFRRSARHFEAEAISLAAALRVAADDLAASRARVAALEAQLAALQESAAAAQKKDKG